MCFVLKLTSESPPNVTIPKGVKLVSACYPSSPEEAVGSSDTAPRNQWVVSSIIDDTLFGISKR